MFTKAGPAKTVKTDRRMMLLDDSAPLSLPPSLPPRLIQIRNSHKYTMIDDRWACIERIYYGFPKAPKAPKPQAVSLLGPIIDSFSSIVNFRGGVDKST